MRLASVPRAPTRSPTRAATRFARGLLGLATAALGVLPARAAWAHARTTTISDIAIETGPGNVTVDWSVRVHPADLLEPLGYRADDDPAVVWAHGDRARRVVGDRLAVELDGTPCAREPAEGTPRAPTTETPGDPEPPAEQGGDAQLAPDGKVAPTARRMGLSHRFVCPARGDLGELRLRYTLFFDLDPLHTGFARVRLLAQPAATHLFRSGDEELAVSVALPGRVDTALQYLALGVEHILIGYDHLAFLLALVLGVAFARAPAPGAARPPAPPRAALRATLALVTAFTVAHSLTLAWAALSAGDREGMPGWVEPAIALSVAWVGGENLLPRPPRRRWLLVLGFGLVHGLGFASVLQEIGLPRGALALSLFAFNLGVELGQLAVVALCLPLSLWAARRAPRGFLRWGVHAPSLALAALGLFWFALRAAGGG